MAAKKKTEKLGTKTTLFSDMMEVAFKLDRLERMYQIRPDKKPIIEFYFEEISDLARAELMFLQAMDKQMFLHQVDYEKVSGHSEYSDCREYQIGPVVFRLRCEKLLDTEHVGKLGVRDVLFTHRIN